MSRLTMAGALLSAALGSVFVLSAAAQAATSGPATGIVSAGRQAAAVPKIPIGSQWSFSGLTYAETSAGLAACNAQGLLSVEQSPSYDFNWSCRISDPDSGLYNLWLLHAQSAA